MADARQVRKEPVAATASRQLVEEDTVPGEEETQPAEENNSGHRFGVRRLLLFIVLPFFLLVSSLTAAWVMGYLDAFIPSRSLDCENIQDGDKNYAACAEKIAHDLANMAPGAFIEIPDMIVNLNSTSKQPRFLKISLKIELENKEDQKRFEAIQPRVVDQFQTYLRELRLEDLRGSSGLYRMKIELLNRVRAAAADIKVRDVLFQEVLVQ
jgi:flagellar protein FliL